MTGQEIAAYFAGVATVLFCGFFGYRLRQLYQRQITGTAYEPEPMTEEIAERVARQFPGEHAPHYLAPREGGLVEVNMPGAARHRAPRSYDEF